MRRRIPAFLVGLVAVAAVGLTPSVAGAHGDLLASSPGDRQVVGGELAEIQLVFSEPTDVIEAILTGPVESVVLTPTELSPSVTTIALPEVLDEGLYSLNYTTIAADSDEVKGLLWFSYDVTAPAALPVLSTTVPDPPASKLPLYAAIGTGVLVVGAIPVVRKWRRLA